MYQAKLFNDDVAKSSASKMNPGIHLDVSLIGVEIGEDYFDINFEKSGLKMNKRLWEPKGTFPEAGETKEDAMGREEKRNILHLVALMHLVVGLDVSNTVQAPSYVEFMRKAAAVINNKASQKRYNLKVVKDKKGYAALPSYPGYVEIHVPGEPSALKFSQKELAALETPVDATKPSASDLPY